MEKLILTIYYGSKKLHRWQCLQVHFFIWYFRFFVESYDCDERSPNPDNNSIDIYEADENVKSLNIEECRVRRCKYGYRVERVARFLCFSLYFTKVNKVSELIDIYGKNYKKENDTLEGAKYRYMRLCQTGYFS